jgi:hypothetical protein
MREKLRDIVEKVTNNIFGHMWGCCCSSCGRVLALLLLLLLLLFLKHPSQEITNKS